jgi:hypothetical protein
VCFRGTLRVNSWERAPHPVVAGQNVKSERSVAVGLSKLNRLAGPARQAVFLQHRPVVLLTAATGSCINSSCLARGACGDGIRRVEVLPVATYAGGLCDILG